MTFRGLKHYARHMLEGDRLQLSRGLQAMRCSKQWVEIVLHRDGPWQTQMNVFMPGAIVPSHRHLRCESVDITLAGSGLVDVLPLCGLPLSNPSHVPLGAQLLRVPRNVWHGGIAGEHGSALLSFQHWIGEPDFISADWEAAS